MPFGEGAITLVRAGTSRVDAVAHLLGGGTVPVEARAGVHAITIDLATEIRGVPVEWVEVEIE